MNVVEELARENPELHREVLRAAAKIPNAEAVLWKIERPGIAPSYLFGTMHVTDPRITTLSTKTQAAMAASRKIALEIADLSPDAMGKAIAARADLMIYADGSRLDQKLTAHEFAIAKDAMATAGLPEPMAAMVRPWFVYMMMAIPACEIATVRGGKLILDAKLAEIGKARKIPVLGLETAIEQIEVIAGMPEADQLKLLKVSLAFADKREDMFETLIQLYQSRRIGLVVPLSEALARSRGIAATGMTRFMQTAVVQRNHTMRDNALPLLQEGGAFIAVGTLHLIGEKGLVALFRKQGYTVTAVE